MHLDDAELHKRRQPFEIPDRKQLIAVLGVGGANDRLVHALGRMLLEEALPVDPVRRAHQAERTVHDEGLDVEDVRAATLDVRERLDVLGLPSFVKTSGGKGFHVVVPLKPRAEWDKVKTFAHDFARAMEQTAPDRYTSVLSKKARKGRIFVDYLRNGRGSTAVAPWSSRGKPNATVAVPVTFDMVKDGVGPADFPIGSKALEDALKGPDPWADFFKAAKPLKL